MKPFRCILLIFCLIQSQVAILEAGSDCGQYHCSHLTENVRLDAFADTLFWKFLRSDLEFQIDNEAGALNVQHLTHNWSWGYRVGGRASCDKWGLSIRYTKFESSESKTVGNYFATHKLEYTVLDFQVDYSYCLACKWLVSPLIGMKTSWINSNFDKLQTLDTSSGELSCLAYGLYLGIESRWGFCYWQRYSNDFFLSFISRATIGNLYGKFEIKLDENTNPFRIVTDEYLYVSVSDLYIALDFTFCRDHRWNAFFQLGYEIEFWNGWRQWFDADALADFGIGGLVLRLGVNF